MKPCRLILFFFFSALAACHSSTHDMKQTAFDALENARVQLDSGNKAEAMKLFKEAEHYGLMANHTLTVAHARYHIAQ